MTYIDQTDMIKNPKLDDDQLHLSHKPDEKAERIEDDNYLYSASANDMTGLAPAPAHNEYEAQSYEELFPYLPPLPPNPIINTADTPISEGIRDEYKTHVSRQKDL